MSGMSQNHTDRSSSEDIEWCYDAVHRVSRTFSLTISELNEPMARDICLGYLLCRVADTLRTPAISLQRSDRTLADDSRCRPSSGTTASSSTTPSRSDSHDDERAGKSSRTRPYRRRVTR
ncbi:hypothetical protein C9J85_07570 [Haloferax sp. wsp5]|nr:hypothetical protein C9J85_07570 [Haloferax sp. wsp5]